MTDGQAMMTLQVAEELEARRGRIRLKVRKGEDRVPLRVAAEPAPPLSGFLSLHYAGSRRLPDLPDSRQVWSCWVNGRGFVTYYEMPLTADDAARMRARLETARQGKERVAR